MDAADQWVFDPALGEYRLRRPDERPAGEPPSGPGSTASGGRRATRHGVRGRRRAATRRGGGAWVAGAAVLLLTAGGGGAYFLLHDAGTPANARPAASASAGCASASPAADGGPAARPGPKAAPIDVRVTVLNGSGTFGQAESVLRWMQNTEGFLRTSNGGPAPHTATTTLVYAPGHADQARTLAAAMKLPSAALRPTSPRGGPKDPMTLTLGQDFRAPGVAPIPAAPAHSSGCATTGG
nr:LytR C-terminal domain-containing protein [Streptomyces sp. SID5468]